MPLTKTQMDELESVDKLLLRRILNAPLAACVESLYLELGLTPIHIKKNNIFTLPCQVG